jgi:hypothetical protein
MTTGAQKIINQISKMRREGKSDSELERFILALTPDQWKAVNRELDMMLLEIKSQHGNRVLQKPNPKLYKIG